jgi:cobalt-zinc-cadmium efflux system membrane fusion protein
MKQSYNLLGLLALLILVSCAKEPTKAPDPPRGKVDGNKVVFPPNAPQIAYLTVQDAEPRRLAITHLTGRLYLADDATVRVYTPVAGQVTAIKSDIGQKVSTGAPLAEIDSPDYNQAQADERSAEANLGVAKKSYLRSKDLFEHGGAAEKDVEAAQSAYVAASAERDRAAARLRLYHASGNGTDQVYVLRSPLDGTVVERNINPGQEVRADQMLANATNLLAPLFVVSDISRLWLQVDAAETDLLNLEAGQQIRVISKAFPGQVFTGTVTNISPTLDPITRAIRVRGVVENPDRLLKAEMYVLVDVLLDESELAHAGVEIPSQAVITIDNKPYLFVEIGPGQFERRQIEIGSEKDGRVYVKTGVSAHQRVVTDGALLLQSVLESSD